MLISCGVSRVQRLDSSCMVRLGALSVNKTVCRPGYGGSCRQSKCFGLNRMISYHTRVLTALVSQYPNVAGTNKLSLVYVLYQRQQQLEQYRHHTPIRPKSLLFEYHSCHRAVTHGEKVCQEVFKSTISSSITNYYSNRDSFSLIFWISGACAGRGAYYK